MLSDLPQVNSQEAVEPEFDPSSCHFRCLDRSSCLPTMSRHPEAGTFPTPAAVSPRVTKQGVKESPAVPKAASNSQKPVVLPQPGRRAGETNRRQVQV